MKKVNSQKMNYLKVTSIANLEMGKRQIEKRFVQNQSEANNMIKQNHMANYNYNEAQELVGMSTAFIPDGRKVKFGEHGQNSRINGKILEEQLRLRSLESEYDLEKIRIEDENNAKTFRIRYPYGKENVRITEDVLEKYKGNSDQFNVLKKFEQEAKQRKQQKKSQKRLQLQAFRSPYNLQNSSVILQRGNRRKATSILERQKKKLQRVKQQYVREVQKSKELQRQQNKRIKNLECMLKDARDKMDENFSIILQNNSQTERNKKFVREVDLSRARLQKLKAVDSLQATERNRVPVVVYKDSRANQQNFVNRSLFLQLMDYERPQQIDKPEQFKKVLNIYNANKARLDRLCQRISVKNNQNTIIY